MILSREQLEPYRTLTVSAAVGFGERATANLRDTEYLVQLLYGENLSFYVAEQNHVYGKGFRQLSRELGTGTNTLYKLIDGLAIPRMTVAEAQERTRQLGRGFYGTDPETGLPYNEANGRKAAVLGFAAFGMDEEEMQTARKVGGRTAYEQNRGMFAMSAAEKEARNTRGGSAVAARKIGIFAMDEEAKRASRIHSGKATADRGLGLYGKDAETRRAWRLAGGESTVARGSGIYARDLETHKADSSRGGRTVKEQEIGIFGRDEETRKVHSAAAGRRAAELGVGVHGINPATGRRYYEDTLPTIHGYRADVQRHTRSAWEANLARLLTHLDFKLESHVTVPLAAAGKDRALFNADETTLSVDFRAAAPNGREYWYEILAHPLEDPHGIAKVRMFGEQYPERKMVVITAKRYYALANSFAPRVEADNRFFGWETKQDNLATNREKWGVISPSRGAAAP